LNFIAIVSAFSVRIGLALGILTNVPLNRKKTLERKGFGSIYILSTKISPACKELGGSLKLQVVVYPGSGKLVSVNIQLPFKNR